MDINTTNLNFQVIEGDLDGYPDMNFYLEFDKPLTLTDQDSLKKVFGGWYNRGEADTSDFQGFLHWFHDPKFFDRYAEFSFDMGSVDENLAWKALFEYLTEWNSKQISSNLSILKKIVLGWEKEISGKIDSSLPQ